MQLYYSERSPYARKVRAVAVEKQVKLELLETMPFDMPAALLAQNPLGKVPVLVLPTGETIYDSPIICEYLDEVGQGARLMPASGLPRAQAQTQVALVDGIIDASVNCLYESMRPADKIWQGQYDKQKAVVLRGIQAFEAQPQWLDKPSIAAIALACAIDYAEHRVATAIGQSINWRASCPQVAQWFDGFMQRDCMKQTAPASWERATKAA